MYNAVYKKTITRDEVTGYTVFLVCSDDLPHPQAGYTLCRGKIPFCVEGMSVRLEGTFRGKAFEVSAIFVKTDSVEATIAFIASRKIPGIGKKKARRVVALSGVDIVGFCKDKLAIYKISQIQGISLKSAKRLVESVLQTQSFYAVFEWISENGGDYRNAYAVYEQYGDKALEMVKANPYLMIYSGCDYSICEKAAFKQGVEALNEKRINALLGEIFRCGMARGDTCMDIKSVIRTAEYVEKNAGNLYSTDRIVLFGMIAASPDKYKIWRSDNGYRISSATLWNMEHSITRFIKNAGSRKLFTISDKDIADAEATCHITLSEEQKAAVRLIENSGMSILTGFPGTGKTTVANIITYIYKKKNPNKKIYLCATTANAAKRLEESTGMEATTVHKFLNIRPYQSGNTSGIDPIHDGLIILDEASMMDTEIASLLMEKLLPGVSLLLIGDPEQLESVGPGQVLDDFLKCEFIPRAGLTACYRQDEFSTIYENDTKIRKGETNLVESGAFQIIRDKEEYELQDHAMMYIKDIFNINRPWDTKVFTPVRKRKYICGADILNAKIHDMYFGDADSWTIFGAKYSVREPVIFIRNNYDGGYCNGDEGIITHIREGEQGSISVSIELNNTKHEEITVSGSDLMDLRHAYVLTDHKAQGGECEAAIIILPANPTSMLTRNLVHVACSRAKQRNILLVQNNALETAIKNKYKRERQTGLYWQLKRGIR